LQDQSDIKDALSAWLTAADQLAFKIIIAGKFTGGVFEDAVHRPVAYDIGAEFLAIHFQREECLSIFHPAELILEPDALLVVREASEVRFSWYEYGRPHQAETLCEEIFWRVGRFISLHRIVPRVTPPSVLEPFPAFCPLTPNPFVQLVPNRRMSGSS
jgi:hypothetical protein